MLPKLISNLTPFFLKDKGDYIESGWVKAGIAIGWDDGLDIYISFPGIEVDLSASKFDQSISTTVRTYKCSYTAGLERKNVTWI